MYIVSVVSNNFNGQQNHPVAYATFQNSCQIPHVRNERSSFMTQMPEYPFSGNPPEFNRFQLKSTRLETSSFHSDVRNRITIRPFL